MQTGENRDGEEHRQSSKPCTPVVQPRSTSTGTPLLKMYDNPPPAPLSLPESAFTRD